MSEHLPECKRWFTNMPDSDECAACEMFRACEQRVHMEDDDYAYVAAQAEAEGRRRGWAEALDAAREAVLALTHYRVLEFDPGILPGNRENPDVWLRGLLVYSDEALADIDALKEKP